MARETYSDPSESIESPISGFSSTGGTSNRSLSRGRLICNRSSRRSGWGRGEVREWASARPSSRCLTLFASRFIFS